MARLGSLLSPARPVARVVVLAAALGLAWGIISQAQGPQYTVYTADGKHTLAVRASNNVEWVALDPVAALFGLSVAEDRLVGGLTLRGRGETILLIPGQSFASIGPGRIVSLPAPLQRDRNQWQVPIEFIRQAIGPAQNLRVDLRKTGRTILVGDVRLPQVTARFDRQGPNARLVFEIQPAAPHRVARLGNRVTIRIDAVALDWTPATGLSTDFVSGIRIDATNIIIELGPQTAGYRADDTDTTHLEITLLAPAPVAPPPPPVPVPAPGVPGAGRPQTPEPVAPTRPAIDTTPGAIRTVVLDPGHGGDEAGAKGPKGTVEKDYVLQFARKLKNLIESRIGVRVILTRDNDESVPVDRRAALANNNKADLFISLHLNASLRPSASGVQIQSLRLEDYRGQAEAQTTPELPVAVLGGGTRVIDVLPWDLAQIGFTQSSMTIASILEGHLTEASVPMFARKTAALPLRPLVGVSMPAVLVELGFITNADDEQALTSGHRPQQLMDAIVATINDVRSGIPAPPAPARAGAGTR